MKFFLVGFFLWVIAGCNNNHKDENVITVDASKIQDIVKVSAIFDSIKYVPLETNDSSLFKDINKLCIDSCGNIYLLDIEGTNAVYMFGKEGQFKRRIGNLGRGPGEYNEISDLNLYQDTILEISDSGQDKIIQYDTSGKMINEIYNIGAGSAQFFHIGDTLGFYMSSGKDAFNLTILVNDKEYSYLKQNYLELRSKGDYFHTDGKQVYCTDNYNDTLYLIKDANVYPYLYIDFQKNKLPEKIRLVEQGWQGDFCFDIGNFKFTSRFLSFMFTYRQDEIFAFYDYKNKEMFMGRSFQNDLDGIPLLLYPNTSNYNDRIVTYLKASIFLSALENGQVSDKAQAWKSKVNEDSNPIVVFAYTKK